MTPGNRSPHMTRVKLFTSCAGGYSVIALQDSGDLSNILLLTEREIKASCPLHFFFFNAHLETF